MEIELVKLSTIIPYVNNAKMHSSEQIKAIAASIKEFGFNNPILLDKNNGIIAGHGRAEAAKLLALDVVPCIKLGHLSDAQRRAYILADNRLAEVGSSWNMELVNIELDQLKLEDFDTSLIGFDDIGDLNIEDKENQQKSTEINKGSLSDRFGVPPFSVLNARDGWWQDRKRAWLSLGIKSEEGREINPTNVSKNTPDYMAGRGNNDGGSIFDPTLCELAYRWFCPQNGLVVDPFAGGSVRGIIASKLKQQYVGIELRREQVEANRRQAIELCDHPMPVWHCGDSRNIREYTKGIEADFIFGCPPYADLEVYSDNPDDLSTLGYEDFKAAYKGIIKETCSLLKNDAFACFIVGEVRGKTNCGAYHNFVGDTVSAFIDAGLSYYNEAILVTCVGTLPIRAGRAFESSRKLGKTHQNILVFVKGDAKKATEKIGTVEFGEVDEVKNSEF